MGFEMVSNTLPILSALLHSSDSEVLRDSCWALSYLSEGTNDKIQAILDAGVGKTLTKILSRAANAVSSPNVETLLPSLRTIGNIVTGDDEQTDEIVMLDVLPCLHTMLDESVSKNIRKEVCWTLSNITAGTAAQITSVIEANIIPTLVHLMSTAEFEVKKEAAWAISNATVGRSIETIKFLVLESKCLKPLCEILTSRDEHVIRVALEGITNILEVGEAESEISSSSLNHYACIINELGGLDNIEALQGHSCDDIYNKAFDIIEKYFGTDDCRNNSGPKKFTHNHSESSSSTDKKIANNHFLIDRNREKN